VPGEAGAHQSEGNIVPKKNFFVKQTERDYNKDIGRNPVKEFFWGKITCRCFYDGQGMKL